MDGQRRNAKDLSPQGAIGAGSRSDSEPVLLPPRKPEADHSAKVFVRHCDVQLDSLTIDFDVNRATSIAPNI